MMRALGPGSVSSVLKAGLDAANILIWIGVVALGLAFLAFLLAQPFIPGIVSEFLTRSAQEGANGATVSIEGMDRKQIVAMLRGPAIPVLLLVLLLYLGGLATITGRLRRIFRTLTQGDPFHPENARRLRLIGFALFLLEVTAQVGPDLVFALLPDGVGEGGGGIKSNFTAWFSIAVVFVLAEVFREGARLRREAELTI
jgi:hypothetical protein